MDISFKPLYWPGRPVGSAAHYRRDLGMGIGLGIVLLIVGLILVLNVITVDIGFIDDNALGWILLLVGVLAIALPLILNAQRSRTTHVEEKRHDGPPAKRYDDPPVS